MGLNMNQTIRLYTNSNETRHKKHLEIAKTIFNVQKKILDLKTWLKSFNCDLYIIPNVSSRDDRYEIVIKTSDYPISISFYLPEKAYAELTAKSNNLEYVIMVLDYIYNLARMEYNKIGEKYNKVSSANIGKSRTLRWR